MDFWSEIKKNAPVNTQLSTVLFEDIHIKRWISFPLDGAFASAYNPIFDS